MREDLSQHILTTKSRDTCGLGFCWQAIPQDACNPLHAPSHSRMITGITVLLLYADPPCRCLDLLGPVQQHMCMPALAKSLRQWSFGMSRFDVGNGAGFTRAVPEILPFWYVRSLLAT